MPCVLKKCSPLVVHISFTAQPLSAQASTNCGILSAALLPHAPISTFNGAVKLSRRLPSCPLLSALG